MIDGLLDAQPNNCRELNPLLMLRTELAEAELTLLPSMLLSGIEDAEEVENRGKPTSATKAMNAEMRMKDLNFEQWEPVSWVFIEFLLT